MSNAAGWVAPNRSLMLRRDFRCAEWIASPVTPLFASWYLPAQDRGFELAQDEVIGGGFRAPFHAVVNGWLYAGLGVPGPAMLKAFLRHPVFMVQGGRAMAKTGSEVRAGAKWIGEHGIAVHERFMPRYRATVTDAAEALAAADPDQLVGIIDAVAEASGTILFGIAEAAGYAWKAELTLRRFCAEHAEGAGDPRVLLAGLRVPTPPPHHAVTSLDWSVPTAGELDLEWRGPSAEAWATVQQRRVDGMGSFAAAVPTAQRAAFDEIVSVAQRFALVREEIVGELTLGWPVMRSALRLLGQLACEHGTISAVDDVFWLERDEVVALITGSPSTAPIAERRQAWAAQAALDPPDALGPMPKQYRRLEERFRFTVPSPSAGTLTGISASPGMATGPVRVVRGPEDFDRVQDGDVLVAPLTAPAWTPLFAHVAAVVTDHGTLAAHASLVARDFGLPAVVATHDGTRRLVDGQVVTVDGTNGVVLA